MVHTDGNQYGKLGVFYNIGGIQIAAHACLKKDKITIFFFKI